MTLHRLSKSSGLLARKGAASPLSLAQTAPSPQDEHLSGELADEQATAVEPRQLTLVSDLEDAEVADSAREPLPPASLLPFALHWKGKDQAEAWELVSPDLLQQLAQEKGGGAVMGGGAAKEAAEPESAPNLTLDEPLDSGGPKVTHEAEDAPSTPLTAETGPVAVTHEPDIQSQQILAAEKRPAVEPKRPAVEPSTGKAWFGWGLAAAILIGGIGWWSISSQPPSQAPSTETLETGKVPEPVAPPELAKEASEAPSVTPSDLAPASPPAGTPDLAETVVPSVDLARVESNGETVIAGRAAPDSELIILHNGIPIGTAKADAFGEWVFVPESPLPQGDHEFGLVLKSVQGKVSLPAPPPKPQTSLPSKTLNTAGSGLSLPAPPPRKPGASLDNGSPVGPVPVRKPELAAQPSSSSSNARPPNADFVVQLASVKTRHGAQQEWRKLRSRYPEVLSGMNLRLYEAELSKQGKVIRVRTGPFPGFSEASKFCAQIRNGKQECLVVRTSGFN